jgi:predicted ATPase/class 3 adenylate cyclase
MQRDLPTGTVTFLFTDVEGSTRLLHELGGESYAEALAEHRRILRDAFAAKGGVEVDTQGDAFFYAFPTAPGALEAAGEATYALASGPIRVRMGIHTGTPHLGEEGYVGVDVHRAARIAAAGHGGQVLVSGSTAALLEKEGLHDLGEHRLKDLSAPERIYQLGEKEFPPLKALYRTNLPIPATPFLGRDHELAELQELLSREDVRLLTLTGPGGTGKTRLGVQAAAEASEGYPDGLFWVPLAPLRDPELVLETAAQALGAKDGLAEHVGDKRLLLLFDNFEHVVDAAGRLSELLAACPNMRLLVTSRELLRVPGEQAYPVPPLEPEDGMTLFVARARAAQPDFDPDEHVPELCARLEQLPLALELAAARVRILSSEQLIERLAGRLDLLKAGRGVDPRQQTLRATIGWSHDLLDEEEQRLFARLAVFAGGCTLEEAEAICDADLDTLQSLVDKSLVRVRDEGRFWMLETIREFAAERLDHSAEAEEPRRRHAEHFLALTEEAEPHIRGYSREWLDRLDPGHDNIRAAADWFEAAGESELLLRLLGAISDFWGIRGHIPEGSRRLESALRMDGPPTAARAKALNGAADMAMGRGDNATLRQRAEEALALHRSTGNTWGAAFSVFQLGHSAADDGDYARAKELAEEAIALSREAGDETQVMYATWLLAWASKGLGDSDRAEQLYEEVSERARRAGHKNMLSLTLEALSDFAVADGRAADAVAMLAEAYELSRELGDRWRLALIASRLAGAFVALGDARTGARVLSSGLTLLNEIGGDPQWVGRRNQETLAAIRAQLAAAELAEAWEQGRKLTADEAVALALDSLD